MNTLRKEIFAGRSREIKFPRNFTTLMNREIKFPRNFYRYRWTAKSNSRKIYKYRRTAKLNSIELLNRLPATALFKLMYIFICSKANLVCQPDYDWKIRFPIKWQYKGDVSKMPLCHDPQCSNYR